MLCPVQARLGKSQRLLLRMPRSGAARHPLQMAAVRWLPHRVQAQLALWCLRVQHVSAATSLGPAFIVFLQLDVAGAGT